MGSHGRGIVHNRVVQLVEYKTLLIMQRYKICVMNNIVAGFSFKRLDTEFDSFLYSFMHSTKCSMFSWAVNCYELHIFSLCSSSLRRSSQKNLKSSLRPKQFSSGSKKQRSSLTPFLPSSYSTLSFLNRLKCAKHLDVITTQRGHVKHNNKDLTIVSCLWCQICQAFPTTSTIFEWCYAFSQKITDTGPSHMNNTSILISLCVQCFPKFFCWSRKISPLCVLVLLPSATLYSIFLWGLPCGIFNRMKIIMWLRGFLNRRHGCLGDYSSLLSVWYSGPDFVMTFGTTMPFKKWMRKSSG